MNLPTTLPSKVNLNLPNTAEQRCSLSTTPASPASPTMAQAPMSKRSNSGENLRAFLAKLTKNKNGRSFTKRANKSKSNSSHCHQPHGMPKKGCLKVLTQEESLLSCALITCHEEETGQMRRLTDTTDDVSCSSSDSDDYDYDDDDDDNDDLYGEWESTPILTKASTISFGSINVKVYSTDSTVDGTDGKSSLKTIPQESSSASSQISLTVDEYEVRRPSGKRKALSRTATTKKASSNKTPAGAIGGLTNSILLRRPTGSKAY